MWVEIALGAVMGAVISVILTAFFEVLRKPNLEMRIVKQPIADYTQDSLPRPAKKAQFLYVALANKDLNRVGKWLVTRDTASRCHGVVSFHHIDGTNIFGRKMDLRWTNSPEPIPNIISKEDEKILIDMRKIVHNQRVDISPGEEELFNIAGRFDDEEECYGWSNWSYLPPLWRNPYWELPSGCYLVHVNVTSSGNSIEGTFRLINDVPMGDFRLEPAQPEDKIRD